MRSSILLIVCLLMSIIVGYAEQEKVLFKVDPEMLNNFKTLSGDARQNYFGDISRGKEKYIIDKKKLSNELIPLLQSKDTDVRIKCGVAYLMGVFRLEDCIDVLIDNLVLYNPEALNPDMPIDGDWPARVALEMIGKPAIPAVIRLLETSKDADVRGSCHAIILGVCREKGGRTVLLDALNKQTDSEKRSRLQEALNTEHFDGKWKRDNGTVSQQSTNQTAVEVQQIPGSGKTNDQGTAGNTGKP